MAGKDLLARVREALGNRYTVVATVGRGGNAMVYGAYDRGGAKVAIKVLHPELAVSVAADRFLREIRFAGQLDHPHIAPVLDSGEDDYLLWYAMPFFQGETLRDAVRRERMLSISFTARIGAEVLEALGHAHAHGVAQIGRAHV